MKWGVWIIGIVLCFTLVQSAEAVALGVSKGVLDYRNVLQGGYAEETFFVSTDAPTSQDVTYEFSGEAADWFRMEPGEQPFQISVNKSQTLRVIVEPPEDTQIGNYTASLKLTSGVFDVQQGLMATAVKAAFNVRIRVEVVGDEFISCVAGGHKLLDAELGDDLQLSVKVRNNGNVRIRPTVEVDVWDQAQTKLLDTFEVPFSNRILPTTETTFTTFLDHSLARGQYWADIGVDPCGQGATVTFDVLRQGEVSDKGILMNLNHKPWAETEEIIPITATFRNAGETTVVATLKASVLLDNKVVGILTSDALEVGADQVVELETFYKPQQPGKYLINGRVLFNEKMTSEKASYLNVNTASGEKVNRPWFDTKTALTLLAIGIVILLLLILIKKKKRKKRIY